MDFIKNTFAVRDQKVIEKGVQPNFYAITAMERRSRSTGYEE
jgi:hypothetical protein